MCLITINSENFLFIKKILKNDYLLFIFYMAYLEDLKAEVAKGNAKVLIKSMSMAPSNLWSLTKGT